MRWNADFNGMLSIYDMPHYVLYTVRQYKSSPSKRNGIDYRFESEFE